MNTHQPPKASQLLGPAHWPSWLALATLHIVAWLPYPLLLLLGRIGGRIARHLMPYRRIIAETNLRLCFPHLSSKEVSDLSRRHFEYLGMGTLGTVACNWGPQSRLERLIHFQGLEHLQQALAHNKGVLLFSAHFTSLEISGHLLLKRLPACFVYQELRDPVFDRAIFHSRQRAAEGRAFHRADTRSFIRSLRDNRVVWYAADQDQGEKHGVFVPFFGVPAATLTTTSRLAKLSGAPVLFYTARQRDDGRGYDLCVHPPLEGFPSDAAEADARRLNALLEDEIRAVPAQYLWIHRRFKTRPPGEAKVYPGKPRRLRKRARAARSK